MQDVIVAEHSRHTAARVELKRDHTESDGRAMGWEADADGD